MKNEYEIRGDITAIFIKSPKYGNFETLVNTSKLERVKEFTGTWTIKWEKKTESFYVAGATPRAGGYSGKILLHRFLTNVTDGMKVDHINHNTVDNTDSNLRIVTNAENMQNRKGAMSNSRSGIRGVCWEKDRKKWKVTIAVNGIKKNIGRFDRIEEAEQAAIGARMKYMPYSQESV